MGINKKKPNKNIYKKTQELEEKPRRVKYISTWTAKDERILLTFLCFERVMLFVLLELVQNKRDSELILLMIFYSSKWKGQGMCASGVMNYFL